MRVKLGRWNSKPSSMPPRSKIARSLLGVVGGPRLPLRSGRSRTPAGEPISPAHIPTARYVDLNRDLSAPVTAASGRHPLPGPERIAARFGELGVHGESQVVAYDEVNGSFAARAWWLLRWLGHDRAAVLDGGLKAWLAAGGALESGGTIGPDAGVAPRESARPGHAASGSASGGRHRGAGRPLEGGSPIAGGCARAGALRRHGRAHGRGGRPRAGCGQSSVQRQPARGRAFPAARELERLLARTPGRQLPRPIWSPCAAPASPPATTCSPWRWRACPAPGSTPAHGANGFAIPKRPVARG